VNLNKLPIMDIKTAIITKALSESSNFFNIPISINAKPANASMSTQNKSNPPAVGKISHMPKR